MSQQTINVGTTANDGTGDALRNAFIKANDNFTELYTDRISGSGTDNYIPRFNGTNALENSIIFDNGTNVGIGTTSPSNSKLVVSGASASGGIMSVDTSSTTSFVRILGDISSQNLINWQDGTSLRFATSTQAFGSFAERMRINSLGEILVGQTSAIYSATNRANLTIGKSAGSILVLGTSTASNGYLFFDTTNVELANSTTSGSVLLRTAGTERMRITSAGNVGIGTTSPTLAKFVLNSGTSNQNALINGDKIGFTRTSDSAEVVYFKKDTSLGAEGTANINGYDGIQFRTQGAESVKAVITSSGNVGIGTTSPTAKLQVVGLPSYADNTTALAGGLTAGAFYHTAGVLKVVI